VQNRYNLVDRNSEDVLEYCSRENIGFIPWFPLATGELAKTCRPPDARGETPQRAASAGRARMAASEISGDAPIPGNSKVKHLEEILLRL